MRDKHIHQTPIAEVTEQKLATSIAHDFRWEGLVSEIKFELGLEVEVRISISASQN